MSADPTQLRLTLPAPVVRHIVDSLSEDARLEITRGVMSNVIKSYVDTLAAQHAVEINRLVEAQVAASVNAAVNATVMLPTTDKWSNRTTYSVQLPPSVQEAIRKQTREVVTDTIRSITEEAIRTAARDATPDIQSRAKSWVRVVIDEALKSYHEDIKKTLRAALR